MFQVIIIWLLIELIHYIYYSYVYYIVNKEVDKQNIEKHTKYMINNKYITETMDETELTKFITGMFNFNSEIRVSLDEIQEDNINKLISQIVYFKEYKSLDNNQLINIKSIKRDIEDKLDYEFISGENKEIYTINIGKDKITCDWKPYLYYLSAKIYKSCLYNILYLRGYESYRSSKSNIIYFYKENKNSNKFSLFYHGFGFGVMPYMNMLNKLSKNSTVIFPILPNISNIEFHSYFAKLTKNTIFPSNELLIYDFKHIIKKFNVDKINLIGHSFGSIIVSIMMKLTDVSSKINNIVMVEPVCFFNGFPKIFKYASKPNDDYNIFIGKFIQYTVYSDIYVKAVIHRYLNGPDFWIYNYDNIDKDKCLFVLSEDDKAVPTEALIKRMEDNNIKYNIVKDAKHAEVFLYPKYINHIKKIVNFVLDK